jgi:hypothetical protein
MPARSPNSGREGSAGPSRRRTEGLYGPLFQDKGRYDKKYPLFDRPKWAAPQLSSEPIPHPDCPYCGKPIRDMSTAIADKDSGEPVHFECVAARIAQGESLEKGDMVVYLGGGRFGVVHFPGIIRDALRGRKSGDDYETKNFQIKKIFEWEDKENRSPWRKNIEDHFSVV